MQKNKKRIITALISMALLSGGIVTTSAYTYDNINDTIDDPVYDNTELKLNNSNLTVNNSINVKTRNDDYVTNGQGGTFGSDSDYYAYTGGVYIAVTSDQSGSQTAESSSRIIMDNVDGKPKFYSYQGPLGEKIPLVYDDIGNGAQIVNTLATATSVEGVNKWLYQCGLVKNPNFFRFLDDGVIVVDYSMDKMGSSDVNNMTKAKCFYSSPTATANNHRMGLGLIQDAKEYWGATVWDKSNLTLNDSTLQANKDVSAVSVVLQGTSKLSANSISAVSLNSDATSNFTANSVDITTTSNIAGKLTVGGGIDASQKKITNVAAGDVSAGSKEAVNGGQLYNAMQNVTPKLSGDNGIEITKDNTIQINSAVLYSSSSISQIFGGSSQIAVGSTSYTSEENTISFGHKAGDPGGSSPQGYTSNLYRRLINVAYGKDNHDVATVGQLISSGEYDKDTKTLSFYTNKGDSLDIDLSDLQSSSGSSSSGDTSSIKYTAGNGINISDSNEISVSNVIGNNNSKNISESSFVVGTNNIIENKNTYIMGSRNEVASTNNAIIGFDNNTIGESNYILGANNQSVGEFNILLGSNNYIYAQQSVAIGLGARVDKNNSIAIGTESYAGDENIISVGHSNGDKKSDNSGTYTSDLYRRLVNVADGVNDHDVTTLGQVKSLVTPTGKIESGNANIVSGDTVYKVTSVLDRNITEQENRTKGVLATCNTLSESFRKLQDSISSMQANNTTVISNLTSALNNQANTDLTNLTSNGIENIQALIKTEVTKQLQSNQSLKSTASTLALASNPVATDANNTLDKDNVDNAVADKADKKDLDDLAKVVDTKADKSYVDTIAKDVEANTKNIASNTEAIKANTTDISDLKENKANTDASNIDVKAWGEKLGTGVIEKDNTELVTGGVVFDALDKKADLNYVNAGFSVMNGQMQAMNQSLTRDINKVGAGAAALAGLHPQDYDPNNKLDFAVGYGHYKNANATALGMYYRPNAGTTFSLAGTIGNGDTMLSAGLSFKLGMGKNVEKVILTKEEYQKQQEHIEKQDELLIAQDKRINEQNEKLKEMEEILKKLMA